jgi:hypothetical protein
MTNTVHDFTQIRLSDSDVNHVDRETDKEILPSCYEFTLVISYNKRSGYNYVHIKFENNVFMGYFHFKREGKLEFPLIKIYIRRQENGSQDANCTYNLAGLAPETVCSKTNASARYQRMDKLN